MKQTLGDVLVLEKNNKIAIQDNELYKIAGVQNYGKGIVIRREVLGKELTMKKYQLIKENQLMWCKVDTKNGAFGLTKKEHVGSLASTNMALATIDESKIIPEFLETLFKIKFFHEHITKYSSGSTNRKYLTPKQLFELIEIPNLSLDEQIEFVKKVDNLQQSGLYEEIDTQQKLLKKLRQSILQEAIEGKLTKEWRGQNPDVEQASVLLEKIKQEKEQLVKEKKIKKQKPLPLISEDEMIVPEHKFLKWCRLSDLFVIEKGNTGIKKAVEGEYPLVVTAEERLSHNEYQIDGEAIIIPLVSSTGHGHASLNRIHYQKGKFAVGSILAALTPLNNDLISTKLYYTYLSLYKDELLVKKMTGAANVTLTITSLSEVIVPFIPLKIQKKIEDILNLTEDFEMQTKQSEQLLQTLMQAVLKEAFKK